MVGERQAIIAFIGSGNYATSILISAFKDAGARLKMVASSNGVSGTHAGRKFGFEATITDSDSAFSDSEINTIVITTRHDSHAQLACQALQAGKHLFVEKPMALTLAELRAIEQTYTAEIEAGRNPLVMVGFNRRFAPKFRR